MADLIQEESLMSKRIVRSMLTVATAVLVAIPSVVAQATETAAAAPKLTVVEPLKDFGTVPKGEKLSWNFVVKNTGTSDLQILSAEPTCGCTVADFDKVIKPGATGKITANVDTAQFNGPISKAVNVRTNDPEAPNAQLTMTAIVKPYVEAYPAGFLRYSLTHGDTDTKSFTLFSEEELPFEITKIEVPGTHVKANFAKITNEAERVKAGREGQNQYRIDVTIGGPEIQTGPLAEKLLIHTNSKRQPVYPVSLTGLVRPRFTVAPTILNFGEVAPGDAAATRVITLETMNRQAPEAFKVTKVESADKTIVASLKPAADAPGRFEVEIKVDSTAKAGALDSLLKIHTNDEITPIVTVPVRGTIVAKAAAK
jgi:hypothetical protein